MWIDELDRLRPWIKVVRVTYSINAYVTVFIYVMYLSWIPSM